MPVTWNCEVCGKEKTTIPSRKGRFCSRQCNGIANKERMDTHTIKECEICSTAFKTKPSHYTRRRTCSNECSGRLKVLEGKDYGSWAKNNTGDKHHCWKGGFRIHQGYKYIRLPSREIAEHRLLMEQKLGRKLKTEEHVHHIDEDKTNNILDNLTIMSRSDHTKHHVNKLLKEGKHYTQIKKNP